MGCRWFGKDLYSGDIGYYIDVLLWRGHHLLHCGTEAGIISRHINMGTSFITSKYFCFNRHLSSGRCCYCFLETQPNILINYLRWKKTSFPPKSKFSWNFIFFTYITMWKKIFVPRFVTPAKLADENSLLRSDDVRPEFLVMKERFKWNFLEPASGGDGGNS